MEISNLFTRDELRDQGLTLASAIELWRIILKVFREDLIVGFVDQDKSAESIARFKTIEPDSEGKQTLHIEYEGLEEKNKAMILPDETAEKIKSRIQEKFGNHVVVKFDTQGHTQDQYRTFISSW